MTTMIVDPPRSATRLGVGLDASRRRSPESEAAWKRAIGTKPIPARLATLPEHKRQWSRLGISAGVQVTLVIFLLAIPFFYPEKMKTVLRYDITELAQPLTAIPVAPPPPKPHAKTPLPTPQPPPPEPVKLNPKQPHIFITPKALAPAVKRTDVSRAPELNPVFEAAKVDTSMPNAPKRPREDVKMNNLGSGSAAPATVNAPVEKVQTGGFGDPNGLPGKADPNRRANVNAQGSVLLPGGPGYGNGTGGAKGIRGTVASTGFGNGTANPPPSGGRRGTVQSSGFGDQTVAEAPKKKAGPAGPIDTPVTILDKPRPEYTAEGRSLKLEGDVVIDLVFRANGTVEINRVVSGLGHGLDEAAVRAAQQIHFKPAKREGQPVDFPARVRIEFRLAY
jgi:TonB family protein